jgi:hypothetical protein
MPTSRPPRLVPGKSGLAGLQRGQGSAVARPVAHDGLGDGAAQALVAVRRHGRDAEQGEPVAGQRAEARPDRGAVPLDQVGRGPGRVESRRAHGRPEQLGRGLEARGQRVQVPGRFAAPDDPDLAGTSGRRGRPAGEIFQVQERALRPRGEPVRGGDPGDLGARRRAQLDRPGQAAGRHQRGERGDLRRVRRWPQPAARWPAATGRS